MPYFWKKLGLNADLKRHAGKEAELRKVIEEEEDGPYRTSYRYLLNRLLASKAELAGQIGKKET